MEATGVAELAHHPFAYLSGGEQQRVMLATALAQDTNFLLLDEPTVHLDLHHQAQLLELLRDFRDQRGIAVMAVLHDLNAAALFFDRIAVLHGGRLIMLGESSAVLSQKEGLTAFGTPLHVVQHPTD